MPLSITNQLIIEAAERRQWQVDIPTSNASLLQITAPSGVYYVRNARCHKGPGINEVIGDNKYLFYQLAKNIAGICQPSTQIVSDETTSQRFLEEHTQVVVKPLNLSHGNGITTGITTSKELQIGLERASALANKVLLQQQVSGDDYRILVIGGKIVAAAIRKPAQVVGDGTSSIIELIETENQQPDRGPGYTMPKSYIDIVSAEEYLGTELQSIPAEGQIVTVVGVANIGRGGTCIDITDTLSNSIAKQTLDIANHFRIQLVGVDFIVDSTGKAYLIEINTSPSFGLHAYPTEGKPRLVADDFLDWLDS